MEDNINITFGSGGFAFAEPGTYEVTTLLVIFDEPQQRELVTKSNPVLLRIGSPRTDDEERDAMDLFSDDVGLYLALGGSSAMAKTRDKLNEIVQRRHNDVRDPVVAHIHRAQAIDESRSYVRYRDRGFYVTAPDLKSASQSLANLEEGAAFAFDTATGRQTRQLAKQCMARYEGKPEEARVAAGPAVLSEADSKAAIESARAVSYSASRRGRPL
jgi:hypothetical protein